MEENKLCIRINADMIEGDTLISSLIGVRNMAAIASKIIDKSDRLHVKITNLGRGSFWSEFLFITEKTISIAGGLAGIIMTCLEIKKRMQKRRYQNSDQYNDDNNKKFRESISFRQSQDIVENILKYNPEMDENICKLFKQLKRDVSVDSVEIVDVKTREKIIISREQFDELSKRLD